MNTSRRTVTLLAPVLLAATAIACEGDEGERSLSLGRYVTLYVGADTDDVACGGTGAHLDRYVERVFAFLAAPIPDDFHVDVRLVAQNPCDESFLGCYIPDERSVYIEQIDQWLLRPAGLLRHEITHAIVDRVWGWSAPFFSEGIAEALARSWLTSEEPSEDDRAVAGLVGATAVGLDYALAARFTRFLVDTHGLAAFKRVYQRAGGRSAAEIHAIFAEVYGVDFAAIEAEYHNGEARCAYSIDSCDPELAIDASRGWATTLAASCGEAEAYGGMYPAESAMTGVAANYAIGWTVGVESVGKYRVRASAPLLLTRCGSCAEQAGARFEPVPNDADLTLEPGLYDLRLRLVGEAGPVSIELFPVADE